MLSVIYMFRPTVTDITYTLPRSVCVSVCVCVTKGNSAVRVAICACTEAHSCQQTLERVWVGKAESQRRTRCVSERELNAHTHTRTFFLGYVSVHAIEADAI